MARRPWLPLTPALSPLALGAVGARLPSRMARGRRGEGEPRAAHCQARRACTAILIASAGIALWLGATAAIGQQDATATPRRASVALEVAHRYARAVPARPDTVVLAAQGTQEGHWRFVNRAGEMFTVGTPDEMTRVVAVLYPQAKAGARLALYMTEDTVFRHGVAFKSLPAAAELNMVVGGESYRLLRRSDAAGTQLYAEVRTNLAVELKSLHLLEEAQWHLARPLSKAGVRLLALEPGGPGRLPASPRIDPGTKRTLVDAVDPAALASAMAAVSGQTLVVLGRVEGDLLYIRPAAGPERSLALDQLYKAADAADVGLVVLQAASTPRQPTGRNALRQDGGGQAPEATLADLLNAVAGPSRRLAVAATRAVRRTVIEASLVGDLTGGSGPRPADARLAAFAGDVAAVGIYAVRANLLTAARQSDLDQRIIPGVPFVVQVGYAALLVLGLFGTPVARTWWARIWPAEAASEYAGRSGYWVACAIRGLAFALVFLPLTALIAAPYSLGGQIRDVVRGPALWWRRIAGRGRVGEEAPRPVTSRQASGRTTADVARAPMPPPVPAPPPVRMPPPAPAGTARRAAKEQPARSWIAAFTREEEPK